jgi:SPP1 gp7 family putative phage head morphogenesis protein
MAATDLPLGDLLEKTPDQIVEWFRSKGHVISWNWRDVWKGAHAQAFTVAKAVQLDVLTDLKDSVQRVISSGVPKAAWVREMSTRMRAKGWWGKQQRTNPTTGKVETVQLGSPHRLETIYRTNAQVAFQTGRYNTQRGMQRVRPFWQYVAVLDSRTRETHAALDKKCWPASSPVWDTIYPPNGYNCRCRVRALTPAELVRKGITLEPEGGAIPEVDEGWNFNAAAAKPLPTNAVNPRSVPEQLELFPMTAQLATLVHGLERAQQRAISVGIDPVLVGLLSTAHGAYARLPGPPKPGATRDPGEPEPAE